MCLKGIITSVFVSRNTLLPLAFTDSWFSFDTSQNLPTDSCNMSKELSSLLTSQDFTLFFMASRAGSVSKGSLKGPFEMADDSSRELLPVGMSNNGC